MIAYAERMRGRIALYVLLVLAVGCDGAPAVSDAGTDANVDPGEARLLFALDGQLAEAGRFYDFPFPSDLRLTAENRPDLRGYPNPRVATVDDLLPAAADRPFWPTIPVGYFRFSAPVRSLALDETFAAEASSPVLLMDVDPSSPERGRLYPTIAVTFLRDRYTGENLVGVASHPGFVLQPNRLHAFVLRRSLDDAQGRPLGVPDALAALARGEAPSGAWGERARTLYAPLFETLDQLGIDRADVAAATVFTTGDVVAETEALSSRVLETTSITLDDLALIDATNERYCAFAGRVSMPQYQRGTPPFDTDGRFELDASGAPIEQRRESVRVIVTLPKTPMPPAGYPLLLYFHGSGGIASQVIDRGPFGPGGMPARGQGPAYVIAEHGFASVGAALPLSPDRLPGASSIEYINFDNLGAFPDTFRQGVIEQRLLLDALLELEVTPAMLGACTLPPLPDGASTYRFDPASVGAMGQSMGGMYTNMIGAVEPRLRALVPTGAGGFWSYFILETQLIANLPTVLGSLLNTEAEALSHLHPALHLLELAWEPAEPLVYVPRLSRRPLPAIPSRPVYEPVGQGDSFFPIEIFDAMALAYGHPQAGDEVWPSMQRSLSLAGLDGLLDYPVALNLTSEANNRYTGVVVQYAGDGFSDPHDIFMQLPAVRYQWGCFLRTAILDGTAVVPAPAPLGTPCPTAD